MPDKAIETVFDLSEGDLRRAITILQSASRMFGKKITVEHIVEIAGVRVFCLFFCAFILITTFLHNLIVNRRYQIA